jgi:hypothetical protein
MIRGSAAIISHTLIWISWGNLAKSGKSFGLWKLIVMPEEAGAVFWFWERDLRE